MLLIGTLLAIGLVVIYSISPILSQELAADESRNYFFYNQLVHVSVGLAAFFGALMLPLKWWKRVLPWLGALAIGLMVLMFVPGLGIAEGGATRWINLGVTTFQPAELVKLSVIIAAAVWFASLSERERGDYKYTLIPVMGVLALLAGFVLLHQRDLGSMLVITAIVTAIFFVSGVKWRYVLSLVGASAGAAVLSVILFPHRMERLQTFFSPEQGLGESGYHLHQALIAVGSGGLFGLGPGESVQVHGYLPEAANDSVFAIIAESFGLLGALFVVGLFALLLYRCFVIAARLEQPFARYLVVGVAAWIGTQAAVNIMAMLGVIPLTGIPLPFISYGGSSMILLLVAMGIVTHISQYTLRGAHEDSRQRRRQRRTHHAHFGGRPSSQAAR